MFKRVLTIIISVLTAFSLSINTFAISADKSTKIDTDDIENIYSIVETERWKQLSRPERAKACQIEKETLTGMPTDDLIQAVISYPFFIDILAFENAEYGYNSLLSECNALQELVTRQDRATCLLNAYKNIENKTENSSNITDLMCIELLLEQEDFSIVMTDNEKSELKDIVLR